MGWADHYIQELRAGETVSFRPRGHSMDPKVKSGQLCTVAPITGALHPGDIVLCKVRGSQYLHLVKAVKDGQVQIGNNKGHINGWTSLANVFGILTEVSP